MKTKNSKHSIRERERERESEREHKVFGIKITLCFCYLLFVSLKLPIIIRNLFLRKPAYSDWLNWCHCSYLCLPTWFPYIYVCQKILAPFSTDMFIQYILGLSNNNTLTLSFQKKLHSLYYYHKRTQQKSMIILIL